MHETHYRPRKLDNLVEERSCNSQKEQSIKTVTLNIPTIKRERRSTRVDLTNGRFNRRTGGQRNLFIRGDKISILRDRPAKRSNAKMDLSG